MRRSDKGKHDMKNGKRLHNDVLFIPRKMLNVTNDLLHETIRMKILKSDQLVNFCSNHP